MKFYPSASTATNDMFQFIGWNGQLQMWKRHQRGQHIFFLGISSQKESLKSRRIQIYRTSSKMLKFINHTWVKRTISYNMKLDFFIWKCSSLIDNFIHVYNTFLSQPSLYHLIFPLLYPTTLPLPNVSIPLSNLSALVLIHDALGLNMAPSMVIYVMLSTEQQINQWWLHHW